jgi:ankyrin repeat protein
VAVAIVTLDKKLKDDFVYHAIVCAKDYAQFGVVCALLPMDEYCRHHYEEYLHYGAEQSVEMLRVLLRLDLHDQFSLDEALGYAAERGNEHSVAELLRAGADPRFDGHRAVFTAAISGHMPVVRQLVAAGGLVDMTEALRRVSRRGDARAAQELIDMCGDGHLEYDGALVAAATAGRNDVVRMLIRAGADARARDSGALVCAAERGHLSVVRTLVAFGADVNAWDGAALRMAAEDGHLDTVRGLLQLGANIHARGDRALYTAIVFRRTAIARTLLAMGADASVDTMGDLDPEQRAYLARLVSME